MSELKKFQKMTLKGIHIVVGPLETVPEDQELKLSELEIRGRIETYQVTTLIKSVEILKRRLYT